MREAKRIAGTLVALVAFAGATPALADDFANGVQAYTKGQFNVAFGEFQRLAEIGHARAQYTLAIMHIRGEGTPKSTGLGYSWMKVAAANGYPQAQDRMKEWLGLESVEDLRAAKELMAQFGPEAIARELLPQEDCSPLEDGVTTPPRKVKVPRPSYPLQALMDALAGWVVAIIYIDSDGDARNVRIMEALPRGEFETAVTRSLMGSTWEPATSDAKPVGAWARFSFHFSPMSEGEMSAAIGRHLQDLGTQADAGDASAQYVSSILLDYTGYDEHYDARRSRDLMEKAARGGLPEAQYHYGQLIERSSCGNGKVGNVHWIHQAAAAGIPPAELWLAERILKGDLDGKVRGEAGMFWLERAAARKYPPAMKALAAALTTAPVSDPARSLSISEELLKRYSFDPAVHELRANAYAVLGDFKKAVSAQTEAAERAQKLNWSRVGIEQALEDYRNRRVRSTPVLCGDQDT